MGSARLGGDVAALGASSEIACGSEPGAPWAAAASVVGAPCGSGSPCGLKSILIVGAEALASSERAGCDAKWEAVSRSIANAGMSGIVGALEGASLLSARSAIGLVAGVGGLGFAAGAAEDTAPWGCVLGLGGELVAGATRAAAGFADWLVLEGERVCDSETGRGGGVPSRVGLFAGEPACGTGAAAPGAAGGCARGPDEASPVPAFAALLEAAVLADRAAAPSGLCDRELLFPLAGGVVRG